MSLENNMKTPTHFIGCPGVLNTGMFCVVLLYSTVGFFGYWRYGEQTKASITLNPKQDEVLAQSAKLMIAVAIFLTYGLQFYVPMEIIWKNLKQYFSSRKLLGEYLVRMLMVIFTVGVAIAIPNLGPFISLVGAVCLSTLGLMFPSVIELVTVWEQENGLGACYWRLWKNVAIILFGVLGFITGTYVSIQEIIEEDKWSAGFEGAAVRRNNRSARTTDAGVSLDTFRALVERTRRPTRGTTITTTGRVGDAAAAGSSSERSCERASSRLVASSRSFSMFHFTLLIARRLYRRRRRYPLDRIHRRSSDLFSLCFLFLCCNRARVPYLDTKRSLRIEFLYEKLLVPIFFFFGSLLFLPSFSFLFFFFALLLFSRKLSSFQGTTKK